MSLLVNRPARDIAVAARGRSGRMLTSVPWQGRVLVGTFQSESTIDATTPAQPIALDELLADLNDTFRTLDVTAADVLLVHRGLVPAVADGARVNLLPEPRLIVHARDGKSGVYSLVGVKFTTARYAAERAVDAICRDLKRPAAPCRTAQSSLPHAGIADVEGRLVESLRALGVDLDRDVASHLTAWYGTEAPAVVQFAAERNLLDRVAPEAPVLTGEIAYAAEHSAAVHLADAVLRRTPLGSAGHPGDAAIARAADVMAETCGWTAERQEREERELYARYDGYAGYVRYQERTDAGQLL
jgi:glycerol-3-phosphate dehydrogenase